ncbi:MAG TPA: CopG family transcriptional regulator [Campylobacterales bacterium]|nr:CopG family transcriptional regulator [Campylobacterales bacterium]
MTNNYANATKMSITLDNETLKELNSVAAELGENKSGIIQKASTYYFDKLDEKIADKRLDNLEVGNTVAIPADEVYKQLGL